MSLHPLIDFISIRSYRILTEQPPAGGCTTTAPSKFKFQDNISVLNNISLSGKHKSQISQYAHAKLISASPYKPDLEEIKHNKTKDPEFKKEMKLKLRKKLCPY